MDVKAHEAMQSISNIICTMENSLKQNIEAELNEILKLLFCVMVQIGE